MALSSSNSIISEEILLGLKSAKTMSDAALASMCDLDRYSLALTTHHPSADVRREGEVIKQNLRQMLKNQQIIMEELQKLEAAVKEDINLDNQENIFTPPRMDKSSPMAVNLQETPTGVRLTPIAPQRERTPKLINFDNSSPTPVDLRRTPTGSRRTPLAPQRERTPKLISFEYSSPTPVNLQRTPTGARLTPRSAQRERSPKLISFDRHAT